MSISSDNSKQSPTTQLSSPSGSEPLVKAGPGTNLAGTVTVEINGLIQSTHAPVRATANERLDIGITIAPHALTSVTSLYIGIAGPSRQSTTPAGAPSGEFRTLLHLRSYGEHAHRLDITWTPTTYGRGTKVELALIYMVTINARQSLIEEMPVEFIVS